jgi:uncharacterized membrane protein
LTVREEDLRHWIRAGLIDASTGDRILAFEAQRSIEQQARSERPSLPELLVYLAAAITAAGVTVLAATNWESLSSPARIAVPAVAATAVFGAGSWLRRTQNAALVRGASLLWLLAGALIVGTVAIAAAEAGWSENDVALTSGAAAVITSVSLWAPMGMHPQIVGMGGAAFLFSTAVSTRAAEDWVVAVLGASLALFGLVALIATEFGVLVPVSSARLLAGAGLAVGAFFAGMPPSPPVTELLALVVVVALVAAGIRCQSLVYVAFGVLTAFAGLLKLILRHVESPTLAGVALIVIGLSLLVAIASLYRIRPWTRWGWLTSSPAGMSTGLVGAARSVRPSSDSGNT